MTLWQALAVCLFVCVFNFAGGVVFALVVLGAGDGRRGTRE